jgi:uncharacterized membrane-anchored protein YitT (DUF2179 family)
MKETVKHDLIRILAVIPAGVLFGVNTKMFAKGGGLFPGGVAGLSVLIQQIFLKFGGINVPYTPINILLNAIPVYIGFRFIGKKFTARSLEMILISAIVTDIIPWPPITNDVLLLSVFGGVLNGSAIGLALKADATSGGTDFIAIFLSERKGIDAFNIVLFMNIGVLFTAGLLFGFDKALYSIIFQYVSTQILHIVYRTYMKQTLLIVTDNADEICKAIYANSHHGATILNSEGSYKHEKRKMVYSVIARSEVKNVIKLINGIDPAAFVNSLPTTDFRGKFFYRTYD